VSLRLPEPLRFELDLGALERNHARVVARLPADTRLICSVKANAYGHGVRTIAGALDALGVHGVATASAPDALALREAGIGARVVLFGGTPPELAPDLALAGIAVTVPNREAAEALAARREPGMATFVKVDCGLGRLGVPVAEARELLHGTLLGSGVAVEGLYTHLPFHDEAGERWARAGLARFRELVAALESDGVRIPVVQALSSPGIAAGLPLSGNAVCPGRLLYGLVPSAGDAASWGLEPVLRSISTRIVHVRRHAEGGGIGGGGRHRIHAGDTTAVIPFGRSNGNLADLGAAPVVVHRGRRVAVASISLEHATLDIGACDAAVGDEVLILGGDGQMVSLAELGAWSRLEPLDALVSLDRGAAP
jgi:alanine racemase